MQGKSSAPRFPKLFKKVPLQAILIVPFVIQTVGAVGTVSYLSFKNGQKAVNNVATQLRIETSDRIEQNLTHLVASPFQAFESYEAARSQNRINLNDGKDVEKFLWRQLPAFPNLSLTAFVSADQAFFGAERQDNGTLVIRSSEAINQYVLTTYKTSPVGERLDVINAGKPNFDPRNRPYYAIPTQRGRAAWGTVFPHITGKTMYIAPGQPVYDATGRLQGVWMASLNLAMIGEFLNSLKIGATGQSFILERSGKLIATSTGEKPFRYDKDKAVQLPEQRVERLKAIDSKNALTQAASQFLQQQFHDLNRIQAVQQLEFRFNDQRQFVQVSPFRDGKGIDWLVVVTVPEADFMDQINANTQSTILFSLLALTVSLGIGILTSRWICQPILQLNQASKAMATGDFSQTVAVPVVNELQELAQSFNRMARQVQESFSQLGQINEQLEQRVEERTAALKATKEEVEATLKALQTTQSQLIHSEKMSSLGQLVAGVAHEVNNPVNFIHGNLSYLREYVQSLLSILHLYQQHYPHPVAAIQAEAAEIDLEFVQSDLPKVLQSMGIGTDRIRQIVLSLRNFSRLDEAECKAVDIHEGIDSTLLILQHRLNKTSESFTIDVIKDYGRLPLIECFPGQLNQVFMNILANAVDALEEASRSACDALEEHHNPQPSDAATESPQNSQGQITIRTAVLNAEWVQITIADNGPGIPQAIQSQIFNPFFTTKPIGKGTGIGMSISYQIITEKHGGKLDCISTVGVGTEFVIQIPLVQTQKSCSLDQG